MKLLKVETIFSARNMLKEVIVNQGLQTLQIDLLSAQGHILAEDIISYEPVPAFARSSVDGFAVLSKDTSGASENIPAFLEVIDEVVMGKPAEKPISSGQCVYVPTGGMIPTGADAVVMVEYCELFTAERVAICQPVSSGKNIIAVGDDVKMGEVVLAKGTRLRAQEIGALACLGITKIKVYKPYSISILSTGDELVAPDITPTLGKIRDINTYMLYSEAINQGYQVTEHRVLADEEELIKTAIQAAMQKSDIVLISGGSSQGKKDTTEKIINELASRGTLLHGLALKPGKPTILGYDDASSTLLVGLPGHPVAAMLVFRLLMGWLWREVTNQPEEFVLKACIIENVASDPGKTTCQLVKLYKTDDEYNAKPIYGKSGLITSLTKSDGFVLIDQNKEGLRKGEMVEVYMI